MTTSTKPMTPTNEQIAETLRLARSCNDGEFEALCNLHWLTIIAALRDAQGLREALEKFAIVSVHRPAQNLTTVHVGYRCDLCDQNGEPVPRDQIKHAPDCALGESR